MIDQTQRTKLLEFLSVSPQVYLLLPITSDPDLVLSCLATALFLTDLSRLDLANWQLKEALLFSPQSPTLFDRWPQLVQFLQEERLLDQVKQQLGRDNLIISFPYRAEQVDKVSYHIGQDQQQFYLTIKPQAGQAPLSEKQVKFNYAGASADLLWLFGVGELADLKQLYVGYEDLYQQQTLISLNTYLPDFGSLNLDISGSAAYAEAVFYLIRGLLGLLELDWSVLEHTRQIASLLLSAIRLKSKEFSSSEMQANSFLAVAELLKLGAQRLDLTEEKNVAESKSQSNQAFSKKLASSKKFAKKTKVSIKA